MRARSWPAPVLLSVRKEPRNERETLAGLLHAVRGVPLGWVSSGRDTRPSRCQAVSTLRERGSGVTADPLTTEARELADLLDGRAHNGGKPIAGIHPNLTRAAELLRALAASEQRLQDAETERDHYRDALERLADRRGQPGNIARHALAAAASGDGQETQR